MMQKILPFVFTFILACQATPNKETKVNKSDSAGITLSDLENQAIELDAKITILNLWATWCKPCIAEMPALEAMQKQLPEGIKLLVASNEPMDRQLRFIEKQTLDLAFVQITSSLESLGVYALPTTLILDDKGNILETMVGARAWDSSEQIDHITSYLDK